MKGTNFKFWIYKTPNDKKAGKVKDRESDQDYE